MLPSDHANTDQKFTRIAPQSIEEQAADWIRGAILGGQFKIGERLGEVYLAERVGVSRGPIRAALLALTTEGLVDHHPRIGRFVHVPTVEEVESVQEIRGIVEGMAARRLAQRVAQGNGDYAWLDELQALVDHMHSAVGTEDLITYFQLSREYHERLVRLNQSDTLTKIHEFVMNRAALFRQLSGSLPERQRSACLEHSAILEAIRRGNDQAAAQLVVEHSRNGMLSITEALQAIERGRNDLQPTKP